MTVEDDPDSSNQKAATRNTPPRSSDVADRIVIKRAENAKFLKWQEQLNARFEGFGRITKNDIANFIFRKHPDEFSESELTELGTEFYDDIHWTSWALEKIRQSKKAGGSLTLDELVARRKSNDAVPRRASTKRSASRSTPRSEDAADSSETLTGTAFDGLDNSSEIESEFRSET